MSVFDIHPDIRRAETLPARFYTDEQYFEASKEMIFARAWHFLGTPSETDTLEPFTILEDFLDEPVLVAKDAGQINCLSNVCTHRGKILVEKECRVSGGVRCGYHGRRFAPDGKFLSMPEFETAENFPGAADDLPRIPSATWGKFLFVSLNPPAPLAEFLSPLVERVSFFDFESLRLVSARDYPVKAHWALYCENYLEGFHIPFVHQKLNRAIDYDSYRTETFRYSSLQTGLAKKAEDGFGFDRKTAALYFFIFPNLMLNFYPWGLSVNVVRPLKKDFTKVSYMTYVSDETKLDRGAGADLETVEFEDQRVVESVQRGIRSRFYDRGRYSPTREQGTHHFHRLIAEFMRGL